MNNASDIILHDKRIMASLDIGDSCAYKCKYCLNGDCDFIPRFKTIAGAVSAIKSCKDEYFIISPGCEQDIFNNGEMAIKYLSQLARFGKILAVATKSRLTDTTINQLASIDQKLKKSGVYLAVEISFASGRTRRDIEPYSPSIKDRVDTLKGLRQNGIIVIPFIRPILPQQLVSDDELLSIVDITCEYADVYAIGDFYYTEKIVRLLDLNDEAFDERENSTTIPSSPFWDDRKKWFKYESKHRKRILKEYIQSKNKAIYDSSSGAILHYLNG